MRVFVIDPHTGVLPPMSAQPLRAIRVKETGVVIVEARWGEKVHVMLAADHGLQPDEYETGFSVVERP